ncbi:LacI family DNA-binding transcriptional regulator, partial [Rhizobium tropici]
MRRPTIADLAKASGVSVATIDRVLNGRHRVREETARRVYEAAQEIGYHAVGLLRQRVFEDLPQYRLGFVLQKPVQAFYQAVNRRCNGTPYRLPKGTPASGCIGSARVGPEH